MARYKNYLIDYQYFVLYITSPKEIKPSPTYIPLTYERSTHGQKYPGGQVIARHQTGSVRPTNGRLTTEYFQIRKHGKNISA